MSNVDRRQLGHTGGPMEDELEEAFDRQLEEGVQRLHRPWREVLVTGFFGGTEVAIGILAFLLVLEQTDSHLLAGLAFSIGFLALLLGHSELFTEGFLIPVLTVAARRASWAQMLKLWGGTLGANLVGGWLMMWLIVAGFPRLAPPLVGSGSHFALAPPSVQSLSLAVIGGAVITLMTRMQHGTDSMPAKIAAAVAAAFLLAGGQLFHSILDSLLIFGALHTGQAGFGYGQWAQWFAYTAVGNIVGGLGLVTLLRLVRSKERLQMEWSSVRGEQEQRGETAS
jgi:formate/nitrite transporter FocA (FNT family)